MNPRETRNKIYEFLFDDIGVKLTNQQKGKLSKLLKTNYDAKMEELQTELKRFHDALERKNKELGIVSKKKKKKKAIKEKTKDNKPKEDEANFFNNDFLN